MFSPIMEPGPAPRLNTSATIPSVDSLPTPCPTTESDTVLTTSLLPDTPGLPIVVQPEQDHSLQGLQELVHREADAVTDIMQHVGAILFRGFDVQNAEQFQAFAACVTEKFVDYRRGASPRKQVKGQVYTSTEAPRQVPIALHCELSYSATYPDRILFYCETPPTKQGQTPIADMQRVYEALNPRIRQQFEQRGIRLIQNVSGKRNWRTYRTWQEMFNTDDRAFVEDFCRKDGTECHWKPDGTLQMFAVRAATIDHPGTGQKIWFNSAHNVHDSWSWEFRHAGKPWLARLAALAERVRRRRRHPDDFPNHCQYGDGGEIALADMEHIRQVLWDHAILFDWQRGDVLLLDNLRVSHGRMPFEGPRRILVAMGQSKSTTPAVEAAAAEQSSGVGR